MKAMNEVLLKGIVHGAALLLVFLMTFAIASA